jgi:uncharacterized protein YggE
MRAIVILALVAAGACAIAAPVAADVTSPPHTITVTASGSVAFEPDVAYLQLAVRADDAAADAAAAAVAQTGRKVIAALRALNVDERSLKATQFQIYSQPTGPNRPMTYMATETIDVSKIPVDKVESVIAAAVQAGANQVTGPAYDSSRHDELQDQALAKALDAAKSEASKVASRAGVHLGGLYSVTVYGPYGQTGAAGGAAMRGAAMMGAPYPGQGMIAGTNTLAITVQAVYEIK